MVLDTNLYVVSDNSAGPISESRIIKINPETKTQTVIPTPGFDDIDDMCIDEDYIFFHDATTNNIVRIDKDGSNSLILGNGFSGTHTASMIEIDNFIYVLSDTFNGIWRIEKNGNFFKGIGNGGLTDLKTLRTDKNNLFVFDAVLSGISKFDLEMRASTRVDLVTTTPGVTGIAIKGNDLFYIRTGPDELRKMSKVDGSGNVAVDTAAIIRESLAYDPQEDKLWIGSDSTNDIVWSIKPNGTGFQEEFAEDVIQNPRVIPFNELFTPPVVEPFDRDATYFYLHSTVEGENTKGDIYRVNLIDFTFKKLYIPTAFDTQQVCNDQNNIFWSDESTGWIVKADLNGQNPVIIGTGFTFNTAAKMDQAGKFLYISNGVDTCYKLSKDGTIFQSFSGLEVFRLVTDGEFIYVSEDRAATGVISKFDLNWNHLQILKTPQSIIPSLSVDEKFLYYSFNSPSRELRKMDKADGANDQNVDFFTNTPFYMNNSSDRIFLSETAFVEDIFSYKKDGTDKRTDIANQVIPEPALGFGILLPIPRKKLTQRNKPKLFRSRDNTKSI